MIVVVVVVAVAVVVAAVTAVAVAVVAIAIGIAIETATATEVGGEAVGVIAVVEDVHVEAKDRSLYTVVRSCSSTQAAVTSRDLLARGAARA